MKKSLSNDHYVKASVEAKFTFNPLSVCKEYDFVTGNTIKYILRYKHKNQALSDLTKALDYLRLLKPLKAKHLTVDNVYLFVAIFAYKNDNDIFNALVNDDGSIGAKNIQKADRIIKRLIEELKHNESK